MKVISKNFDAFLTTQSKRPCLGFITGPLRSVAAIAQCALSVIAILFHALTCGCFSKGSMRIAMNNGYSGMGHFVLGLLETVPGSYFCLRGKVKVEDGELLLNIDQIKINLVKQAIGRKESGLYSIVCNHDEVESIQNSFPQYIIIYLEGAFTWTKM